MMKKVNVAGTESFVERLSKSFQTAREKGLEVPNNISIEEKGEFAIMAFPIENNGEIFGDFKLTVLKTLSGKELFDLMREEVNKIDDSVTEGCFERNIQGKLGIKCVVPGLTFNGSLKREFMRGLITEGERAANMINAEAC